VTTKDISNTFKPSIKISMFFFKLTSIYTVFKELLTMLLFIQVLVKKKDKQYFNSNKKLKKIGNNQSELQL
jgi:hypothetical protein